MNGIFKKDSIIYSFPFKDLNIAKCDKLLDVYKPACSFRYINTIKSMVLNYNKVIKYNETPGNMKCDCASNNFIHPMHKHVITGDMNFVKNPDLRKLLNKGLNFRLPKPNSCKKRLIV